MKCPNDGTEMESGSLVVQGSRWINKIIKKGFVDAGDIVIAYKCPKCGKIELTTGLK